MKKIAAIIMATVLAGLLLAGCTETDVVLKYSPGSLDKIITAYPSLITDNTTTDHYFYLTQDKETTLKVSHDYSMTGDEDIAIVTPLKPFTDARLDVTKLGTGYKADGDKLILAGSYGEGTGKQSTITDSVFQSVKYDRTVLTYHQALDHYGIKMTAGKFEWAKDYTNNDKDIVFALYAKPLADIGVDVQQIDGWIFKTMQDENGNDVDMLVKPYDMK
jgi:hypothetical protein